MSHVFRHPKYYEELRKQGRKLTSSQATVDKQANPEPKAQASSQNQQAPEFSSQRTSE